jgi:Mg2+/Co2+ transporter CorB
MVGLVMAVIAFVLEKMVLRSIRKAGKSGTSGTSSTEELHTTLTSKGGEVDLTDAR